MNRRGFLLGALAAPVIVKAAWIMPVKKVLLPPKIDPAGYASWRQGDISIIEPIYPDQIEIIPSGYRVILPPIKVDRVGISLHIDDEYLATVQTLIKDDH